MESVRLVFDYFCERTPRSFVEARDTSVVWNYKYADGEFGRLQVGFQAVPERNEDILVKADAAGCAIDMQLGSSQIYLLAAGSDASGSTGTGCSMHACQAKLKKRCDKHSRVQQHVQARFACCIAGARPAAAPVDGPYLQRASRHSAGAGQHAQLWAHARICMHSSDPQACPFALCVRGTKAHAAARRCAHAAARRCAHALPRRLSRRLIGHASSLSCCSMRTCAGREERRGAPVGISKGLAMSRHHRRHLRAGRRRGRRVRLRAGRGHFLARDENIFTFFEGQSIKVGG